VRICTLTASISRRAGGLFNSVRSLSKSLSAFPGVEVSICGLHDGFTDQDGAAWRPLSFQAHSVIGPRAFGFSPALRDFVLSGGFDIVHLHGIWQHPSAVASQWHWKRRRPNVISPRGMLEPWALQNSRWKKRIASWLFENRNLRTASCLHALCQTEADNFRRLGLRNPIAVIPNGVDMSGLQVRPGRGVLEARFPVLRGHRWILFLSRIHPKKGLPHLLRAWAALQKKDDGGPKTAEWVLTIAGWDQGEHEAEMKQLAAELGLEQQVCFTGPLHGQEKLAALAGAELFVLPSFSEGFSMAVLEASAAGLPVLLTPQCNFPELAKAGAAIEVAPDVAGCEAGLRQMLGLSDAERRAMGQRGKDLVAGSYTWPRIAEQMLGVYHWLLEGGTPPACVRLES